MIIYIDKNFHCYTTQPECEYITIKTDFFNGKCKYYIEGHCYEIVENGYAIYSWKPYNELDRAQREYEIELLNKYKESLLELGVEL